MRHDWECVGQRGALLGYGTQKLSRWRWGSFARFRWARRWSVPCESIGNSVEFIHVALDGNANNFGALVLVLGFESTNNANFEYCYRERIPTL